MLPVMTLIVIGNSFAISNSFNVNSLGTLDKKTIQTSCTDPENVYNLIESQNIKIQELTLALKAENAKVQKLKAIVQNREIELRTILSDQYHHLPVVIKEMLKHVYNVETNLNQINKMTLRIKEMPDQLETSDKIALFGISKKIDQIDQNILTILNEVQTTALNAKKIK